MFLSRLSAAAELVSVREESLGKSAGSAQYSERLKVEAPKARSVLLSSRFKAESRMPIFSSLKITVR